MLWVLVPIVLAYVALVILTDVFTCDGLAGAADEGMAGGDEVSYDTSDDPPDLSSDLSFFVTVGSCFCCEWMSGGFSVGSLDILDFKRGFYHLRCEKR